MSPPRRLRGRARELWLLKGEQAGLRARLKQALGEVERVRCMHSRAVEQCQVLRVDMQEVELEPLRARDRAQAETALAMVQVAGLRAELASAERRAGQYAAQATLAQADLNAVPRWVLYLVGMWRELRAHRA